MLRPLLYDIKRTITSKTVLILVAIILLISLAIVPFTSISNPNIFRAVPVLYYHDQSKYHFLALASNQYGDSLSGVAINITLQGTTNYSGQGISDSSGIANFTIQAPQYNYFAIVSETLGSATFGSNGGSISVAPLGQIQTIGDPFLLTVDKSDSSKMKVQVFFAGNSGAVPSGYSLYYRFLNSSIGGYSGNYPYPYPNNMTLRSGLTQYTEIFDLAPPSSLSKEGVVWLEIFNQTARPVAGTQLSASELRPPTQTVNTTSIASFFFSTILALFVPLMVIIGSYSSYGKDRLTGVLESILARPVTRMGLALSRFLTTIVAFSAAVLGSVGVVDLLLYRFGGSALPGDYALSIMGGLVVEVFAFTGLIFLLSHLVKSTGLLLGLSIVIFLILDFFWSLIIFLFTFLLGGGLGSAVAIQVTLASYYANPAQFLTLINTYFFQSASGVFIQSSSYGVTIPAIVADGILWAIVPFIIFLLLAVKRD